MGGSDGVQRQPRDVDDTGEIVVELEVPPRLGVGGVPHDTAVQRAVVVGAAVPNAPVLERVLATEPCVHQVGERRRRPAHVRLEAHLGHPGRGQDIVEALLLLRRAVDRLGLGGGALLQARPRADT